MNEELNKIKRALRICILMIIAITGAMANTLVISVNDGKMPVIVSGVENGLETSSEVHQVFTSCEGVNACILADRIKILNAYTSIGDLLLLLSAILFLTFLATDIKKTFFNKNKPKKYRYVVYEDNELVHEEIDGKIIKTKEKQGGTKKCQ